MNTIVFDIETQNFFTDPGVGWDNFAALRISVVCAYSYAENAYATFFEGEMAECAAYFARADRIVGFSSNRYDIPVLQEYFKRLPEGTRVDLKTKQSIDLLEEVESALGRRVSLDVLAQANLGRGKSGTGVKAIDLYREGKLDELAAYCRMDVELTKALYDLYLGRAYFLIPDRFTDQMVKVDLTEPHAEQTHLF